MRARNRPNPARRRQAKTTQRGPWSGVLVRQSCTSALARPDGSAGRPCVARRRTRDRESTMDR
jgi:hypothetical protein